LIPLCAKWGKSHLYWARTKAGELVVLKLVMKSAGLKDVWEPPPEMPPEVEEECAPKDDNDVGSKDESKKLTLDANNEFHALRLLKGEEHSSPHLLDSFHLPDVSCTALVLTPFCDVSCVAHDTFSILSEKDVASFVSQCLKAVVHMHNHGVVHCDMTPQHMPFCVKHGRVTLLDFGLSVLLGNAEMVGFRGTSRYAAPEVLRGGHWDNKVDIWAFGVCLLEKLLQQSPLVEHTLDQKWREFCERVASGEFQSGIVSKYPALGRKLHQLILDSVCHDPRDRKSAVDLLKQWNA